MTKETIVLQRNDEYLIDDGYLIIQDESYRIDDIVPFYNVESPNDSVILIHSKDNIISVPL